MKTSSLPDAEAAARAAATRIAELGRQAVAARDAFHLAVSGGTSPGLMLGLLAQEDLPWKKVHIYQVDERIAPAGDPHRNAEQLKVTLLAAAPLDPGKVHWMPVESEDLDAACSRYASVLRAMLGEKVVLDCAHLGLGQDGHTASLVPEDPVLESSTLVALTRPYRGHRRMTLTFAALDQARSLLWLVTGRDKQPALGRLLAHDPAIPAGRLSQERAELFADAAALTAGAARGGCALE